MNSIWLSKCCEEKAFQDKTSLYGWRCRHCYSPSEAIEYVKKSPVEGVSKRKQQTGKYSQSFLKRLARKFMADNGKKLLEFLK